MGHRVGRDQHTLQRRVRLSGVGVHSGKPAWIAICPSAPDTGISFVRTDLSGSAEVAIPAQAARVGSTELCTVLGDPAGASVATVEHLMSALFGLGVDNAVIEIDGGEVPVMDGSAKPFVDAIDEAGLQRQPAAQRVLRIRKPVRVELGEAYAEFRPYPGCRFEIGISYDCPVIGSQAIGVDLTPKRFRKEVARARTFGHMKDVERLWAAGLAMGSSLDNTVVVGDEGVMNPEGLRYPDEFVRHKLLDAIGDLALAGAPIQGLYRAYKGGHKLNALALSALLAQPDAWTAVHNTPERVRGESRGDFLAGMLAPAFAPEFS
jgi:UDP-3-O-[3-hydroxymyristoyl] N-acetylglucosamine deacetylase